MASLEQWDQWARSLAPSYPHEKVVQFTFRRFGRPVPGAPRALDLGCGAGVHTVFLAAEGFRVTGLDYSAAAVEETGRELHRRGLDAELIRQDVRELDLGRRRFDLVICVGVLEAVGPEGAAVAVRSVPAVMAPGAHGLFLFAGERDDRLGGANPFGLHGYSRAEVDRLFATGFETVWVDHYVTTYEGGRSEEFDWLVTVRM